MRYIRFQIIVVWSLPSVTLRSLQTKQHTPVRKVITKLSRVCQKLAPFSLGFAIKFLKKRKIKSASAGQGPASTLDKRVRNNKSVWPELKPTI